MKQQVFEIHRFSQCLIQGKITVLIIAQNRSSSHGKVAADLMHSACTQLKFQKGAGNPANSFTGKAFIIGFGFSFLSPYIEIKPDYPVPGVTGA